MGIVLSYLKKLRDPRWQKMRLQVFERDHWSCRICETKETSLHAHHPHYHPDAEGPWDYDIDTIITLCEDCHENEHANLATVKADLILALVKIGFCTSDDFQFLSVQLPRLLRAIHYADDQTDQTDEGCK